MFTDKRIVKVPSWARVAQHVHSVVTSSNRTSSDDGEPVYGEVGDYCEAYLLEWGFGLRIGISRCGDTVYFSQEGEKDVEQSIMIARPLKERGRVVNEGAI